MNGTTLRIFMVDDHPLVREWLGNLLRLQPGWRICGEAGDPGEALRLMASETPDIAIVDLSLQRSSGLDLIKQIKARFASVRIIVLSMHEEATDVERSLRAGASGYVMKRESTAQIVAAIRQVAAGGIFANPEILGQLTARFVGRPARASSEPGELLSDREMEVFRRLGEGASTREIAERLGVGLKTVQTYCARIKEKLGMADGAELNREAFRWFSGQRS